MRATTNSTTPANASADDFASYTPSQVRQAYGFNDIDFTNSSGYLVAADGSGQTIAIVEAYNDPNLAGDVDQFDKEESLESGGQSLYQQYGPASSFLTVVNQNGKSSPLPKNDPVDSMTSNGMPYASWSTETSLDVEWAHAIAPGTKILLVEADNGNLILDPPSGVSPQYDLIEAAATAASYPGVSVVSMSWGCAETANESSYDRYFTTPSGDPGGVTFVASSGDDGYSEYPAASPNVLAVGGTDLILNGDSWSSETSWQASGEETVRMKPARAIREATLGRVGLLQTCRTMRDTRSQFTTPTKSPAPIRTVSLQAPATVRHNGRP